MNTTYYDVFLSHRDEDKPWVEVLARNLKACGYRVFLDKWEMQGGRLLAGQLDNVLEHSHAGILVATPESLDFPWVVDEYEKMMALRNRTGSSANSKASNNPGSNPNSNQFTILPLVFGEVPAFPFIKNHLYVDFSDSSPGGYRTAFHRLLSALARKSPGEFSEGSTVNLPIDPEIPAPLTPHIADMPAEPLVTGEVLFLDRVFDALATGWPVLLLAQNGRERSGMYQAILQRAGRQFGKENCYHVVPPRGGEAPVSDYLSFIARRAGLVGDVTDAFSLEEAFYERLETGAPLFLLITRLAVGSGEGRRALAGVLRNISEQNDLPLRLVLCGSEELALLRFDRELSLLNHAHFLHWPEPTVADVLDWQDKANAGLSRREGQKMTREEAARLLDATGGHPQLLYKCLRQWAQGGGTDYEWLIRRDPELTAVFAGYRGIADREKARLRDWLGGYSFWPEDKLLRRLFWDNLLVERGDSFVWRCGAIRRNFLADLGFGRIG